MSGEVYVSVWRALACRGVISGLMTQNLKKPSPRLHSLAPTSLFSFDVEKLSICQMDRKDECCCRKKASVQRPT